jgi:tetratricopeptide (TPR) repeat protein
MLRSAPTILLVSLLVAMSPGLAAAQDTTGAQPRQWSVDLDVEAELTPEQKISRLNQQIMQMQSSGERGPQLGDLYNDLGVLHAQREEWAQARDAFIHAVQAKPYDPDFHRNLGLVFQRLEDWDLAIRSFEQYRDTGGAAALDAPLLIGRAYEELGDLAGAEQAYRDGLQALGTEPTPHTPRLALALAGVLKRQERGEDLRNTLERWQPVALQWREIAGQEGVTEGVQEAEAIETNLLSIYLEDGQILEDSGLYGEALELYQKAYEMAPDRDELLPRIVLTQMETGDALGAKVTARLAREDHPDQAGPWLATAKIAEAEGRTQEALDAYRKAFDIAPETPGLRLKVGNLYMKLGRDADGRRFLAEVLDDPETPTEVVFNYGVSLLREKKYAAATPALLRVTSERPDFVGGWQALAACYRGREQYARAVDAYRTALDLQPDPSLAYNLGVTAGQAEMWDVAIDAYDEALVLSPGALEPAYNRAVALMRAGRLDEAAEAFAAYREQDPDHYRAALNHGVTLYRLGRYEDAVDVYNVVLEMEETAGVWDNLGLAYKGLGDEEMAQKCFQTAKKMRGES